MAPPAKMSMTLRYHVLLLAALYSPVRSLPLDGQQASPQTHLPVLTRVAQVRSLSPEQARQGHPVRLRVIVTYFDSSNMFVQDPSGAIWVEWPRDAPKPQRGELIDLEGTSTQADFAPDIVKPVWHVIDRAPMPAPRRVSIEQLASTRMDGQWVEVEGMVRSAQVLASDGRLRFIVEVPGGHVAVYVPEHTGIPARLVDSRVRLHGAC